ncbi:MAG: hypothetical protein ABJJ53_18590 [Sulfitobacter sp.]
MKKPLYLLRSIWSKIAIAVGFIASLTAILTVDYSPPLASTVVHYMNKIDQRALQDGTFRAFVADNYPELQTKAANNAVTTADLSALDIPTELYASFLAIDNQSDIEVENLTVSFTFYKDTDPVFSEQFAGELTIGAQRMNSSDFQDDAISSANYIEVCLVYDGSLPLEKVTERFLVPIGRELLKVYGSKIEYDRKRRFGFAAQCHQPPREATIASRETYINY